MDTTLLAGLIGAAATVAVGFYQHWRGGQRAERIEKETAESLQSVGDAVRQRFGITARRIVGQSLVKADGDATLAREWHGLGIDQPLSLDHIPGKFHVSAPNAALIGEARLSSIGQKGKALSVVERSRTKNLLEYAVKVAGGFTQNDDPLSYRLEVDADQAYLMSRAEVKKAYQGHEFPNEYDVVTVDTPCDELHVEVKFEDGACDGIDFYPVVFYGPSELTHDLELKRSRDGFQQLTNGARFEVTDPIVGFRYGIYWTPS